MDRWHNSRHTHPSIHPSIPSITFKSYLTQGSDPAGIRYMYYCGHSSARKEREGESIHRADWVVEWVVSDYCHYYYYWWWCWMDGWTDPDEGLHVQSCVRWMYYMYCTILYIWMINKSFTTDFTVQEDSNRGRRSTDLNLSALAKSCGLTTSPRHSLRSSQRGGSNNWLSCHFISFHFTTSYHETNQSKPVPLLPQWWWIEHRMEYPVCLSLLGD